jgi:hypothetical protein
VIELAIFFAAIVGVIFFAGMVSAVLELWISRHE